MPLVCVCCNNYRSVQLLINSAYVKAAARDIKAYLRGVNSETLVGYAAVDGEPEFRDTLADYLTCGEESIVVDLYGESRGQSAHLTHGPLTVTSGLNNYEWCGDSNYNASGWASIVAGFSEIPVASYMSEYGSVLLPLLLQLAISC